MEKLKIFDSRDFVGILSAALSEKKKEEHKQMLAGWGVVDFSKKEIDTMPKQIKKLLILQNKRCRLRTRTSGKDSTTYEIRFRCNGFNISASGKTIDIVKAKFIEKLKTAKPIEKKTGGVPVTFSAFAMYHFENFKKEKVSKEHYKNTLYLFDRHLAAVLKETPLDKITPKDCKDVIRKHKEQGKGKTADDLYAILNGIFKTAIAHGIIKTNPLALVVHTQHERKNGKALTREEETALFNALNGTSHELPAALGLYCGLRPNEYHTAQIDGLFIKAVNSKRKNGKTEYKRIPITDKLREHLPNNNVFDILSVQAFRNAFKKIFPNHKIYDLRTTFYTRCDELGVSAPARDYFVGHSNGALTTAYRDLSEDYLLKESEKLNQW